MTALLLIAIAAMIVLSALAFFVVSKMTVLLLTLFIFGALTYAWGRVA